MLHCCVEAQDISRIGERVVHRLTNRWQRRLDTLDAQLEILQTERRGLEAQAIAIGLQAAVCYLSARSVTQGEICFDPRDPGEEQMLDATIELLVKPRLATIQTLEPAPGRLLYRIEPNWGEIRNSVEELARNAASHEAPWLSECLTFIDQFSGIQKE